MKKYFWIILGISTSAFAGVSGVKRELLLDIKSETKRCAVQLVSHAPGGNQVTGYQSTCATLKIASMAQAQIYIDGEWFTAKIMESEQSDGGDLDDLYILNSRGILVAKRINIPAYDSVIVAMAGTSELKH